MGTEPDFERLERFDAVDATGEAEMFVRFLEEIEALPEVVSRRRRSYDLLNVEEGDVIADVGCGLGTAARELASLGARVHGFDASEEMISEARSRSEATPVEFAVADVVALPLGDDALSGYRAERLYQHLPDPAAALEEARRVLRPGGRIVLVDQDWDAFVIDGYGPTRAVLSAFADSFRSGQIGLQHRRLLLDAGFVNVIVEADTDVITSPNGLKMLSKLAADAARERGGTAADELDAWLDDQAERAESGRGLAAMTHFLARGEAP